MRSYSTKAFGLFTAVATALTLTVSALAQKVDKKEQGKLDAAQNEDMQALGDAVDAAAAAGQPPAGGVSMKWEQAHYLKGQQNRVYVPFTVAVDPQAAASPAVAVLVRVVDPKAAAAPAPDPKKKDNKDKKAAARDYPWEQVYFMELPRPTDPGAPIRLNRAFSVVPGDYDVYVAMKPRTAPGQKKDKKAAAPDAPLAVLKQHVAIPNYWTDEFTTSTLILTAKMDPLPNAPTPEQQAEMPYAIGATLFTPSFDAKFSKKGEFNVVFFIYNAALDAAKKPDVTLEYSFFQKTGDGEKFFNKTAPVTLNASSLPPQFDAAAGYQLPGTLGVPLGTFPEGDYRLEIKITDNISKKTMTRDVRFTVTA